MWRRSSAIPLLALALVTSAARADIPVPPVPLWGTPAPRVTQRAAVIASARSPAPPSPALRDPVVAMVSETIDLVFHRALTEVRSTLVLEGGETDAHDWPMGIIAETSVPIARTPSRDLHFLEVRVGGQPAAVAMRAFETEAVFGPPLVEAWYEWRVTVPAHARVTVEVSYAVANVWGIATGDDWRWDPEPDVTEQVGYLTELDYQLAEGLLYRGGRGPTHVHARRAPGLSGRWRVRVGSEPATLHDEAALSLDVDPSAMGPLAVQILYDGDPFAERPPVDPSAPAWVSLADRALCPFPFVPTEARPFAPAYDAASFEEIVDALHAAMQTGDARAQGVARDVLSGLASCVTDGIDEERDESWGPAARPRGPYGMPMDDAAWSDARARTAEWIAPGYVPSWTLDAPVDDETSTPRYGDDGAMGESPERAARLAAIVEAELRTRLPSPDGAPFRHLAESACPPFGVPNQLVAARMAQDRPREALVVAGATLGVGGLAFAIVQWRRRRRR